MSLTGDYIDWREGIENVYQMHGPEMAIRFIYEPSTEINEEAQRIVEATIQLRTGNTLRAFELIEPFLSKLNTLQEDQKKDAFIVLGNRYLEHHDLVELKQLLGLAINSFPEEVHFYILRAKLHQITEEISIQESLKLLQNKFTSSVEVLVEIANNLFQNHQNEEARPYLEKALSIDSNNVRALNLMGYIELEAENDKAAYDHFNRSVEIWPFQLTTLYSLIDVTLILRNWENVYTAFEYALNYFPTDPKLLLDFASVLVRMDFLPQNEIDTKLRSITQKLPNNAHAHQYLAYFLVNSGSHREALEEINKSIKIEASDSAIKLKSRIESSLDIKQ